MTLLRSISSLTGLFAATVIILPFACLFGLLDPSGRLGWLPTRLWAWTVLLTGGAWTVRGRGFENLRSVSGAVVMSNHESYFDPVAFMALSTAPLRFLARHQLFYFPIFGWAMWANRHISIRRSRGRNAYRSVVRIAHALRHGRRVVVFPEGTRATRPELLPFKPGGFIAAIREGRPIIPVGVYGTRDVCPKGWHWAGQGPVALVVGEPIETRRYNRRQVAELMTEVRSKIVELREQAADLATSAAVERSSSADQIA